MSNLGKRAVQTCDEQLLSSQPSEAKQTRVDATLNSLPDDVLRLILSQFTQNDKLNRLALVNRRFHSLTFQPASWARATHLVVNNYSAQDTHVGSSAQIVHINSRLFQKDPEGFEQSCVGRLLGCLLNVQYLELCQYVYEPMQKRLHGLLPTNKVQHDQKQLSPADDDDEEEEEPKLWTNLRRVRVELRLRDDPNMFYFIQAVMRRMYHYNKLQDRVQLSVSMSTGNQSDSDEDQAPISYNDQWCYVCTLLAALRARCVIYELHMDYITLHHALTDTHFQTLCQVFKGARIKRLGASAQLLLPIYADNQSIIGQIMNLLAPDWLTEFKWTSQNVTAHNQMEDLSLRRQFITHIQPAQFTQMLKFESAEDSLQRDQTENTDVYFIDCDRLLAVLTDYLHKMPFLRELSLCPSKELSHPFGFNPELFLTMIGCLMDRAMQHDDGFKVSLTNVLCLNGARLEQHLRAKYPKKLYNVFLSMREETVPFDVFSEDKTFELELVVEHLASERTLQLNMRSEWQWQWELDENGNLVDGD